MSSPVRIEQLRFRAAPLDMTDEQFRALGHELVDRIAGFLASVRTRPVTPAESPQEVRKALAAFCQEHKLWFHVDGAYGAFASAVAGAPPDLKALQLADSVAVDPHKWLYAPLEAGCALVRDAAALRNAFSYHPPYYNFEVEATNYFDLGPQNSRGFRAHQPWFRTDRAISEQVE
jgi:glutamate/tyrosine decarboxylase-like PLP-dependent enzyme